MRDHQQSEPSMEADATGRTSSQKKNKRVQLKRSIKAQSYEQSVKSLEPDVNRAAGTTIPSVVGNGSVPAVQLKASSPVSTVQLSRSGSLSRAGSAHERQADAVADRVVQGQSAASLLATIPSSPPRVQLREMSNREKWQDATAGLTRRQSYSLSTTLRWTQNLHMMARPPDWDGMTTQCDQLLRDLPPFFGEITTRAAAELAPALEVANTTKGFVESAKVPNHEARKLVSKEIFAAGALLELVADKDGGAIFVGENPSVVVRTPEELTTLIEQAKASDNKMIPGTHLKVENENDEAAIRARYEPKLSDDDRQSILDKQKEMRRGRFAFEGALGKKPTIDFDSMQAKIDLWKDWIGVVTGVPMCAQNQNRLRLAQAKLDRAKHMVLAKRMPVENALTQIQRYAMDMHSSISNTLNLRPFAVDPDHPEDNDGDGQVDEMPGLGRGDWKTNAPETVLTPEEPAGEPPPE